MPLGCLLKPNLAASWLRCLVLIVRALSGAVLFFRSIICVPPHLCPHSDWFLGSTSPAGLPGGFWLNRCPLNGWVCVKCYGKHRPTGWIQEERNGLWFRDRVMSLCWDLFFFFSVQRAAQAEQQMDPKWETVSTLSGDS